MSEKDNMLKIMNYENIKVVTDIDLDKLDNIVSIKIIVISGDELCEVLYKDGTTEKFDSSNNRLLNFNDGSYYIYNKESNVNIIDRFNKRKSSYDL